MWSYFSFECHLQESLLTHIPPLRVAYESTGNDYRLNMKALGLYWYLFKISKNSFYCPLCLRSENSVNWFKN